MLARLMPLTRERSFPPGLPQTGISSEQAEEAPKPLDPVLDRSNPSGDSFQLASHMAPMGAAQSLVPAGHGAFPSGLGRGLLGRSVVDSFPAWSEPHHPSHRSGPPHHRYPAALHVSSVLRRA